MDIETDIIVDQNPTPSNPVTDYQAEDSPLPGIDSPEPDEGDPAPAPKAEEPIPKGVQKRIDRAVRQKYEAEARAKMLEERVAAMEARQFAQQPAQQRVADVGEPTIDKFENFDEYVAAKAAYIANKQIESTLSEREQRQKAEREAAERAKTAESWNKRIAAATVEMPDFEDVLSSSDVPMTPPMHEAIVESEVGPKLAYYLATHPDEAVNIARMSPIGAIRAIGRIEERLLANKPVVKPTDAPPPVAPVGTRSPVKKDPGKMSDAEYEKWRKSAA